MSLAGRTAVVTGAAAGIGRADIDEVGMAGTSELTREFDVRVSRHRLDVADRVAVAAFPDIVAAEHSGVDVLVNNAGVAVGGTFEQVADEDFEWLFEINFWGVVRMTRAFLPLLRAS
jgi:NAD(P)-dependent dehydrogenase (short-subunit alcohol dehydrogenase family)